MISKLPIEKQISWLSSHAAGVMKAHAMNDEQRDFWQVILNVTNHQSDLEKRIKRCENDILDSGQFRVGFTLVEVLIVVGIIGLLMAIAVPNFITARATATSAACIGNLRQIDAVIQQWAIETKQSPNEPLAGHESELAPYMRDKVFPTCPAGNLVYTLGGTVNEPNLSCPNADKPKTGMHKLPSH